MSLNKKFLIGGAAGITATDYFAPVTYTGNGTSSHQITGVGFQPDIVWLKNRDAAVDHRLFDSIRGSYLLAPNTTNNEALTTQFSSFDSDGFTLGGSASNYNSLNNDYVAWCWKAGGTAVSNTDGSITSSVSASPESGFSIVQYTAPSGSTTKFTAGHGLSASPQLVITRRTGGTSNWYTYTEATGSERFLMLNQTNAQSSTITDFWGTDGMSSTTIGLTNNQACYPSEQHIAYCFHSVEGFSDIGSYTGGTANQVITTGFKPRFIFIKGIDSATADHWVIYDTVRSPSNPMDELLLPNLSDAENVNNTNHQISSEDNGFKLITTQTQTNASGGDYIYLAIA